MRKSATLAVVPFALPAPARVEAIEQPNGFAESPGNVDHRGVDADHQIALRQHGGGVVEVPELPAEMDE